MATLSQRELDALLASIEACYELCDLEAYPTQVMTAIQALVPAEIIAYNEADFETQTIRGVWDPADLPLDDYAPCVERYLHQNPLSAPIQADLAEGRIRALRISDFASSRQYRRTDLYQTFYRHFDCNYQMTVTLGMAGQTVAAFFALNRALKDFSDADRTKLQLLGPHLQRAWLNARRYTGLQRRLGLSGPPEALAALTPREAEVLGWVARGKTNQEIAVILGVSVSTVKRHLERAFVKLGVESRAAAAVLVSAPDEKTRPL